MYTKNYYISTEIHNIKDESHLESIMNIEGGG